MIKVFRKIRQNLTYGNKLSKYLLYAIGEIILVVIGIMIAIQLNGWNESRVETKEYDIILENLENEFGRTKELLATILTAYETSINANVTLMQLFEADSESFSAKSVDTLLGQSIKQAPFYPPQPVLDELLNSGKIKSLPKDNLKQYLFDWESTIKWFHFDYDLFINFNRNLFDPFITRHWSWKNIDIAEGSEFFEERSRLTASPKELFQ